MADMTKTPGSVIEHRRATIHELRVEQRADGADGDAEKPPVIVGHAAVFDAEYAIGPEERPWFIERVARGAFLDTIAQDDIRALFNHVDMLVLGRNKSGTLKLAEDDVGLAVEIYPDMDSTQARDVVRAIQRGDVSQMSIGMTVKAAAWEIRGDGTEVRTIQRVQLWDVSPVTFPASRSTEVSVRSAFPPAELRGYVPSLADRIRRHDAEVTATL